MEIAKNQKGFKRLNVSDETWNNITSDLNKILLVYGSNGKGKSTIKDLFQIENLSENFDMKNEERLNLFYKQYGTSNFLVFDEMFVGDFVYREDSLQKN